ncbi:hypothetical protein MKX07_003169 [Trichoderma sp. CBMAI-0711]|nr:hypothetical protein MKX07_003169 [Trichoderma sp. CBMAI-0711]
MRDQISPNGKLYRFKPYHKWDDWTQRHCHVPKAVRNHMVVVIRESPTNDNNWRVATTRDSSCRSHRCLKILSRICSCTWLMTRTETWGFHVHPTCANLELRQKSYDQLIQFMKVQNILL